MWIGNRCAKWCYQPGCTITNIECSRRTNAIMLWKWASHYDRSCIRTNGMLMSIWFGASCIVRLLAHTSGRCQRLWCAIPINRSKSVSIDWCGQFGILFTIGKFSSKHFCISTSSCFLLFAISRTHSIRCTNWFLVWILTKCVLCASLFSYSLCLDLVDPNWFWSKFN